MKLAGMLKTAIPFVWFGAVSAISFMEAPLKFKAPNLTTPVALEVGHIVFDALNKAEWVLCICLVLCFVVSKCARLEIVILILVVIVLVSQTFWLFPILDERTLAVINGQSVPESNLHLFYIVLEATKVVLLIVLGLTAMQNMIGERKELEQDV